MASMRKPWLTPSQQIAHLKSEGVGFRICSESAAEDYLRRNNNYFRLKSYRANFARVQGGPNDGRYIGLDFGMLVDLSIIDMRLRNEMLSLTLDVEHFAKVRLLSRMEERREDGYEVVRDFLQEQARLGTHPYEEMPRASRVPTRVVSSRGGQTTASRHGSSSRSFRSDASSTSTSSAPTGSMTGVCGTTSICCRASRGCATAAPTTTAS